ncbi:Splicing factor 3B subunit 1 [Cyanidiococcus yangmingshanensis]|uniref:Splicing factor 3B subunit 1 n=1 Tax=Cyanidiococcus yangmingshanensis TaxID=2690220 RepID=A0A7J7ICH5_9RHOD|nr:Splicing factor 3B subunit 1 [Cyanidiococcus yangmingshanensis]
MNVSIVSNVEADHCTETVATEETVAPLLPPPRKRTRWDEATSFAPESRDHHDLPENGQEALASLNGREGRVPAETAALPEAVRGWCRTATDETFARRALSKGVAPEHTLRALLQFKNAADASERKAALRVLTTSLEHKRQADAVFGALIDLWQHDDWKASALLALERALPRLVAAAGQQIKPYASALLEVAILGRMDAAPKIPEPFTSRSAKRSAVASAADTVHERALDIHSPACIAFIKTLSEHAGLAVMIQAIRPWFESPDNQVRQHSARIIALLACIWGFGTLEALLESMLRSQRYGPLPRETAALALCSIALMDGPSVRAHLPTLVRMAQRALVDPEPLVKLAGARAVSALAATASLSEAVLLEPLRAPLWDGVRLYRDRTLTAFLAAAVAIISSMDDRERAYQACSLLTPTMQAMRSTCPVRILEQLLELGQFPPELLMSQVLPEFHEMCFIKPERAVLQTASHHGGRRRLARVAALLAEDLGAAAVLTDQALRCLSDPSVSPAVGSLALETTRHVLAATDGGYDLSPADDQRLVQGLLQWLQAPAPTPYHTIVSIAESLGERLVPWLETLGHLAMARLQSPNGSTRTEAARLVSLLVPIWSRFGQVEVLGRLGTVLAACYSEVYPEALARLLEALATILDALATELQPRHVPFAEILSRLTLVLRNPAEEVQAAAVYLVMVIARHAGRSIPDTAWLRVAPEMRDTLGAQRRRVRYRAVEAYGWVARVLGRIETLVGPLLSVLQQSDRSMRIAAAVALAIAAAQDLGSVLPLLLDAYVTEEDKHVQTGVIKAIGFLCSFTGAMKRVWDPVQVYAVTRLLESALVERYETHRQVACETVGHFALALVDQGYEEALVHLLDHVWPNYIALGAEVSDSHLTHAVEFAVRALGVALGAGVLHQYLAQGLFHPAKAVRGLYWPVQRWLGDYFGGMSGSSSCLFALAGPECPEACL